MMNKNKFITSVKKKPKKGDENNDLYTFILLADTPGYRMKSYGPTPLISLQNKKLIDIQIESIASAFKNVEIIICCGLEIDKVYKHIKNNYCSQNIRIVENQICNNSNYCESLRLSLNNTINNKIYVLEGSLLFFPDLFKNQNNKSYVYIEENPCENLEVGININKQNDAIEHFSYGGIDIWSEIIYLHDKDIIDSFKKIISNIDYKNKFIFEALNELIKVKSNIGYFVNQNPVKKISNIKTYHSIKELI